MGNLKKEVKVDKTLRRNRMNLFQITNFFDVKDDPVLGFSPPTVVTVFHTHVWEGAIDYRFV